MLLPLPLVRNKGIIYIQYMFWESPKQYKSDVLRRRKTPNTSKPVYIFWEWATYYFYGGAHFFFF